MSVVILCLTFIKSKQDSICDNLKQNLRETTTWQTSNYHWWKNTLRGKS